jgi:hypothetical protein
MKFKINWINHRCGYYMFLCCWILNRVYDQIPRCGSILNGLGSKFNTTGLNIQRWKMTPGSIFNPVQNILLHQLRAAKFRPMLGAQGGIFILPHLLWHGTSVFPVSSERPPHLVASYDTRGDVEDLFYPGSSRGSILISLLPLEFKTQKTKRCIPFFVSFAIVLRNAREKYNVFLIGQNCYGFPESYQSNCLINY